MKPYICVVLSSVIFFIGVLIGYCPTEVLIMSSIVLIALLLVAQVLLFQEEEK